MDKVTDKVLEKIRKEQLKPRPRWQFLLREGGQWAGFALLALAAAALLGLLWYFWSDGPWLSAEGLGRGLFFGRGPLVLSLLLVLAAVLALLDFRSTGRGYRYPLAAVAAVLVIGAAAAGWGMERLGVSRRLDAAFSAAPLYQDRESYMKEVWQRPEDGLLAGEITEAGGSRFRLEDFDGKEWTVEAGRAVMRHGLAPAAGLKVKMIGRAVGSDFVAEEVRPWMGRGGCGQAQANRFCGQAR